MPDQARIAVLRRVDGLFELTVGTKKGDLLHECREALSPLPRSSTTARLLDAWGRLGAAREITPALTDDVLEVLARTTVDPDGDRPPVLPLSIELPPPPHKPTAANPRRSVSTPPGATALTRMDGASSTASCRTNPTTACLDAV